MNTKWAVAILALVVVIGFFAMRGGWIGDSSAAVLKGFDEFGYNDKARIFNGTGASWCLSKGLASDCMGDYSPDKLVMKWNADWDRGNAEGWANPPYDAWLDNEWNGRGVEGGSDSVWHYKIKWIGGDCGPDYTELSDGSYCIWGQFATVMDQGIESNEGPHHAWFAKAKPNGYGN
jgi:hypothetical protein